ncbi:MAG: hypothetical protein QM682_10960 [Paracoccus sp. (in: a-proteobacteria)]|uniref:hypothetical protein n=1 Tax=Paracoccus sp. TaxID=267 RepID=UPI0039E2E530
MGQKADAIQRLQRLAKLKSDIEMRRFAAYREHVELARGRIAAIEAEMRQIYAAPQAFSVAEARLANTLAGERSRALLRAEAELRQMLPGFEAARRAALREFGRSEVLNSLCRDMSKAEAEARQKRQPD